MLHFQKESHKQTNKQTNKMSRPKNPEKVYQLIDAVTGLPVPTNPKQFNDLLSRYNLTQAELMVSYVGQAGRNKLKADGETVESAVAKYGLHPNVANALKALRPIGVKNSNIEQNISVEVPLEANTVETDAPEGNEADSPESDEVMVGCVHEECCGACA